MYHDLTIYDEITGFYSEKYFFIRLEEEIRRHIRNKNPFTLILLEIKELYPFLAISNPAKLAKIYRDIKNVINMETQELSIIASLTPNKFGIILPETETEEGMEIAEKIVTALREKIDINELQIHAGISIMPPGGISPHTMVFQAETALVNAIMGKLPYTYSDKIEISANINGNIFIGRQKELSEIYHSIQIKLKGEDILILLGGTLGVGKTELLKKLPLLFSEEDFICLYSEQKELGVECAFSPFIQMLEELRDIPDSRNKVSNIISQQKEIFEIIAPGLVGREAEQTPEHGAILPVDRFRIYEAILTPFLEVSSSHPLIMIFDDFQWSDEKTLEFFPYFLKKIKKYPIAVVIAYRQGEWGMEKEVLQFASRVKRIPISPFNFSETREMLRGLLLDKRIEEKLIHRIYTVTKGNPFYITQIVKHLVEKRILSWKPGKGWVFSQENLVLPDDLKNLLRKRFEGLSKIEKKILYITAIAGTRIKMDTLEFVLAKDRMEILDAIDTLLKKRLVNVGVTGIECFHPIFEKIMYEEIPENVRKNLHKKLAYYFEKKYLNDGTIEEKLIAFHFEQAGLKKQAHRYFLEAAYKAKKLYNMKEAVRLFELALENSPGKKISKQIKKELIKGYRAIGKYTASEELIVELLKEKNLSQCERFELLLELVETYLDSSRFNKAKDLLFKIEKNTKEFSRCRQKNTLFTRIYQYLSWLFFNKGNLDEALNYAEKAQYYTVKTGNEVLLARILNIKGNILSEKGKLEEAEKCYESALTLFKEPNCLQETPAIYSNLSDIYAKKGLVHLAVEFLEKALEINRKIGHRLGEAIVLYNLGEQYLWLNELGSAVDYIHQYMNLSDEIDNKLALVYGNWALGVIEKERGRFESAKEYLEKALENSKILGTHSLEWNILLSLVHNALEMGDIEEARKIFDKITIQKDYHQDFLMMDYTITKLWLEIEETIHGFSGPEQELKTDIENAMKIAETINNPEFHLKLGWLIPKGLLLLGHVNEAKHFLTISWKKIQSLVNKMENIRWKVTFMDKKDIQRIKELIDSLGVS